MQEAHAVNAIPVTKLTASDGSVWLETTIPSTEGFFLYEEVKKLPKVVEFEGMIFSQSGWNSDKGKVYYSHATVAFAKV